MMLDAAAQRYKIRPSEMAGIADPWKAINWDVATMLAAERFAKEAEGHRDVLPAQSQIKAIHDEYCNKFDVKKGPARKYNSLKHFKNGM
jgi:hypothetical protein